MGQVVTLNDLIEILPELKAQGKKIVTTNGCFDILHAGHVRYLNKAKALGDILIIGLNSDKSVKSIKGPTRPINCEDDRAEVISALSSVDFVVMFEEDTPANLLAALKSDIHVKGGDYTEESLPEAEIIKAYGGKIAFIPLVEGRSTTNIIEKARI